MEDHIERYQMTIRVKMTPIILSSKSLPYLFSKTTGIWGIRILDDPRITLSKTLSMQHHNKAKTLSVKSRL